MTLPYSNIFCLRPNEPSLQNDSVGQAFMAISHEIEISIIYWFTDY